MHLGVVVLVVVSLAVHELALTRLPGNCVASITGIVLNRLYFYPTSLILLCSFPLYSCDKSDDQSMFPFMVRHAAERVPHFDEGWSKNIQPAQSISRCREHI